MILYHLFQKHLTREKSAREKYKEKEKKERRRKMDIFYPNVAQLPDDKNNERAKSVRSPSWLVAVYKMAPGRPEAGVPLGRFPVALFHVPLVHGVYSMKLEA